METGCRTNWLDVANTLREHIERTDCVISDGCCEQRPERCIPICRDGRRLGPSCLVNDCAVASLRVNRFLRLGSLCGNNLGYERVTDAEAGVGPAKKVASCMVVSVEVLVPLQTLSS